MKTLTRYLLALLASLVPLTTGYSQQTFDISTFPRVGGAEFTVSGMLGSFGGYMSRGSFTEILAIGQTFTAPAPSVRLDRFGFWLAGGDNCAPDVDSFCDMNFLAVIARWNPAGGLGAVLWSEMMDLGPYDDSYGLTRTHIQANPLLGLTGGMYAALLLPVSPGPSVPAVANGYIFPTVTWSANLTDVDYLYPGGAAISYTGPPGTYPSDWAVSADMDWSFDATMTATPEPVTVFLLGTGLIGLGLARRRRHRG